MVSIHCYDSNWDNPDSVDNIYESQMSYSTASNFYNYDYSTLTPPVYGTLETNKVEFSYNTYINNFASNSGGLLDIKGVFRVYFYNDTFIFNGENNYQTQQYL